MNGVWLAHSAGRNPPVPPQPYSEHIKEVSSRVERNLGKLLSHYGGNREFFRAAVIAATAYHDMGKLDDANQAAIYEGDLSHLPVNHVDSGTAHLLENDLVESAMVVYSHHRGLPSIPAEQAKDEMFLRDEVTCCISNDSLGTYLARHSEAGLNSSLYYAKQASDWNGLTRRIALSCLVDGDHGDTARYYGREFSVDVPEPRWRERLAALDRYVEGLGDAPRVSPERIRLRRDTYHACRNSETEGHLWCCDSPVGTGKTTAVMAHLLRVAIKWNLRHIIVVLPYTNIIKQSVEEYRKALVLPGEDPCLVVAEHHHQVDFDAVRVRQLATLWQAPIVVTTAVQFFETIAGNRPSRLRKLHELPGSGVFIDECHAAIPTYLWPQTWEWLKDLTERWNCHFVLASGSLPRFWELEDFVLRPQRLPDLVCAELRKVAVQQERSRIVPTRYPEVLDIGRLMELVLSTTPPRLLIMNTVQSAAAVARAMAFRFYGERYTTDLNTSQVLHLSTALAPVHRDRIIKVVERRLSLSERAEGRDFTLVATSCIEAGLNFSFRSALRERAGVSNLIQVGGRVRRHGEGFVPILIDFQIEDTLINRHPAFELAKQILEKLFEEGRIEREAPSDLITEALRRELMCDTHRRHLRLMKCEDEGDYPAVAELYQVIASNTKLILIDQETIFRLQNGETIDPREIARKSVQMWISKIGKTCAYELKGYPGLYGWPEDAYDEMFLGYMKGMLPLIRYETEGFGVI
jgi:CRISPR-associated endonuclease/helicase Cas3